jgi:hypothetical protein
MRMEKPCIECKVVKPLSEYYKHPQMADGTVGVCKECHKARMIKRSRNNPAVQAYERERAKTPKRRELNKRIQKQWLIDNPEKVNIDRVRNPHKYRARMAVGNALRSGLLVKGECEVCGSSKVTAHHADYDKPLEVVWLCHQHHSDLHPKWHRPYIEGITIS